MIADSTRKKYSTSSARPMLDMMPNSRLRSCTAARNDDTAITNPRPRPMVEMRPSVELVTLPENRAENFCSKVSGPEPPTVS